MMDLESLNVVLSDAVARAADEVLEIRRDLHRHPELGNEETRTQQVVLDRLAAIGVEARPMAGTGVVGLVRGKKPGKVLIVRADMDALPIAEENDVSYRSENPGVMHACGHDSHTAMLLVLARLLAEEGIEKGACKLVFQPAEEGCGGALKMLEEGVLENPGVDASIAFHVWTPYEIGRVAAVDGPIAASVDGFKITVIGKGAHAARPEEGIDPVSIAAQIIVAAQALVTRCVSALDPAVLSFTALNAGSAFNIIPDRAEILGTFRTFDNNVRETIRTGLEEIASSIARSFGGGAHYESLVENIPTLNDPVMAALAREVAAEVVGSERIVTPSPLMVGEDIGEIHAKVPGALVMLGCGNSEIGADRPHHHPHFNIDERVMPLGVEIGLRMVRKFLSSG
ncbi:MAG: amidohydrolase [Deltaproteobacteria bacterium]|nr:amidohydrolase [Deltaproteobacteria bacterium]